MLAKAQAADQPKNPTIRISKKEAARLIIPRENPLTPGHLSRTALGVATSLK
jgi:hypothetical protein